MHSWKCVTLVDDENNVSPHSWFYTEFKQNFFLRGTFLTMKFTRRCFIAAIVFIHSPWSKALNLNSSSVAAQWQTDRILGGLGSCQEYVWSTASPEKSICAPTT